MRKKLARNEADYIAQFILRKLIPMELVHQTDMKVYIRKMKHQDGQCWAYENSPNPNHYRIVINSELGRVATIRAIAHEVVHVMQYVTGKMKDLWGQNKGKVLWKNTIIQNTDRGAAYFNSPWEKEAYGMQERLTRSYLKHRKNTTI